MRLAWHTAYFSRVENDSFPSLQSVLIDEKSTTEKKEQSPEEILAMVKVLNAALGGEVVEN